MRDFHEAQSSSIDDLIQNDAFISEKVLYANSFEFLNASDTEDTWIEKLRLWSLLSPIEDSGTSATTKQISLESQTETLAEACKANTDQIKQVFVQSLLKMLRNVEFEFGYETQADKYVGDALTRYGTFAREWLNDVFLQSFNEPQTLSAILRVIAHFDYSQVYPQGMTIAIAATRHEDTEVQECGIRCFENWESKDSIPILRNLTFSENWMNDYLEDVIADLEGLNT